MPPIRWLRLAVITVLFCWTIAVTAEHPNLPLASNGWRPILGENRPEFPQSDQPHQTSVKQQKPKETTQKITPQSNTPIIGTNKAPNRNKEHKHSNHGFNKNTPGHIRINHHGSSGHYMKHTSIQKQIAKPMHKPTAHPVILPNKLPPPSPPRHSNQHLNSKRQKKPHRQTSTFNNRDELIAPAPSSAIGSYAYFNGPFNIRDTQIRDTSKQFGHHDFRYNLQTANNDLVHHLHPAPYTFAKHPSQNELHNSHFTQYFNQNDDFTRNLVPPPVLKPLKELKDVNEKKVLLSNPSGFIHPQQKPFQDIIPIHNPYSSFTGEAGDLEITKENLREFHTTIAPPLYTKASSEVYPTFPTRFTTKAKPNFGYEVTEDKHWQDNNNPFYRVFGTTTPFKPQTYPTVIPDIIPNNNYQETTMFLPTPFKPENPSSYPTSPTQADISTIYSQLSKRPYQDLRYKEVATHFPIFDSPQQPLPTHVVLPIQEVINNQNDVTTIRYKDIEEPEEITLPAVKPTQETLPTKPTTKYPSRNRLNQRRRRPTRPTSTTTTENINTETETYKVEKPKRRRPIKYQPVEPVNDHIVEPTRATIRRKPARVLTTSTEESFVSENYPPSFRPQDFQKPQTENYQENQESGEMITELYDAQYVRGKEEKKLEELPYRYEQEAVTEHTRSTSRYYEEPEVETTTQSKRRRVRPSTTDTVVTNVKIPENELDYTTVPPVTEEPTSQEVYYQPEPEISTSTTTTTTTTTETPSTKPTRTRRPTKYDTHRPRFSVKDYRQRLNQYTSTTTEISRVTNDNIGRIKYPSRFTKSQSDEKEETTESYRQKFKPKDPRHRFSTTESSHETSTTEKYRPTRRPFSRVRTTVSDSYVSSTTALPKVSIKSNIFSNLKRPSPISLRSRINNKNKTITTTTEAAFDNDVMEDEISTERIEATVINTEVPVTTTETFRRSSENFEKEENGEQEINDDAEAFLQLQRISELTSSAKNNPAYFKTMSSTSRRVPSYFKIATDDPILPIEAFFPNLNNHKTERLL